MLPSSKMVLVTFPLMGGKQVDDLFGRYLSTSSSEVDEAKLDRKKAKLVLLGSTRAFEGLGATRDEKFMNPAILPERSEAERELINRYKGTVLNLAGLWGRERQPRGFIQNVFGPNGERVNQAFSLHLIHGSDVARAVLKMNEETELEAGRWIVTDTKVYDEWEIGLWKGWTSDATRSAIEKAMAEQGVKKLPRPNDALKRWLDSTEFWRRFGLEPKKMLNEDSGAAGNSETL